MACLVIAEHDNAELKPATLHTGTAAAAIGGDIDVLVAGSGCGAVGEAVDSEGKRFRQVAPVMAGMQRGSEPARVREASKTDTDALLAEAGYGADQIEKLKEDGVIA